MGCHTWFYKKMKGFTKKELLSKIEITIEKELKFADTLINNRESIDKSLLLMYPEWTPEFGLRYKKIWEGYKKNINKYTNYKDIASFVIKHGILNSLGNFIVYIPKKGWYKDLDEYHDLFRRQGYPNHKLFSLEETLKYIKDKRNNCIIYDDTVENLKEFWEKYPDGMIDFG